MASLKMMNGGTPRSSALRRRKARSASNRSRSTPSHDSRAARDVAWESAADLCRRGRRRFQQPRRQFAAQHLPAVSVSCSTLYSPLLSQKFLVDELIDPAADVFLVVLGQDAPRAEPLVAVAENALVVRSGQHLGHVLAAKVFAARVPRTRESSAR